MRGVQGLVMAAVLTVNVPPVLAQVSEPLPVPPPTVALPAPPPATMLEGFHAYPGTVLTMGFEELGRISGHRVVVEIREVRDSRGNKATGVTLLLSEDGAHRARAFVDSDELPALVKGLDAVLNVDVNPTLLKHFETRYTTRDNLSFVAYSNLTGAIVYAVESKKPLPVSVFKIDAADMVNIRGWLEVAVHRLGVTMPSSVARTK